MHLKIRNLFLIVIFTFSILEFIYISSIYINIYILVKLCVLRVETKGREREMRERGREVCHSMHGDDSVPALSKQPLRGLQISILLAVINLSIQTKPKCSQIYGEF